MLISSMSSIIIIMSLCIYLNFNGEHSELVCVAYLDVTRERFARAAKEIVYLELEFTDLGSVYVHILYVCVYSGVMCCQKCLQLCVA